VLPNDFGNPQSVLQALSEFRSTTTQLVWLNDLPLGLPVYPPLSTEADSGVSSERAQELGTLRPTLDRPSTFYP
jgi:hypothetical protein